MSLKKDLFSGVFYTAGARYSGLIVSLVIAGVLARLIPPEDFGVVAVATVIISFFGIFSDLGVGAAVIQNKILTDGDLSKIYSFTVWTGVLLAVLFFAASWLIAAYYEKSILKSLCQWLSVNLLFASVNIVPNALLHKAKRFRFLAVRNLVVQVGFCRASCCSSFRTGPTRSGCGRPSGWMRSGRYSVFRLTSSCSTRSTISAGTWTNC